MLISYITVLIIETWNGYVEILLTSLQTLLEFHWFSTSFFFAQDPVQDPSLYSIVTPWAYPWSGSFLIFHILLLGSYCCLASHFYGTPELKLPHSLGSKHKTFHWRRSWDMNEEQKSSYVIYTNRSPLIFHKWGVDNHWVLGKHFRH